MNARRKNAEINNRFETSDKRKEEKQNVHIYKVYKKLSKSKEALRKLRNNKAPRIDGVTEELPKYGGEHLINALHKLIVTVRETDTQTNMR